MVIDHKTNEGVRASATFINIVPRLASALGLGLVYVRARCADCCWELQGCDWVVTPVLRCLTELAGVLSRRARRGGQFEKIFSISVYGILDSIRSNSRGARCASGVWPLRPSTPYEGRNKISSLLQRYEQYGCSVDESGRGADSLQTASSFLQTVSCSLRVNVAFSHSISDANLYQLSKLSLSHNGRSCDASVPWPVSTSFQVNNFTF